MSSRLPLPGDLIDNRYRVQRELGAGAMSVVYEARHDVTGKRFALKWLLPEWTAVQGTVQRFIREAQIGAQIEHPNLVEVYDIGQDGGSLYIVMELLEGEPLSERLVRVQRLTPRAACELLCPCMEAVALAHEAGIVHRDLKPANIYVCRSNPSGPEQARVLDFGVAKLASGSQLDGQSWPMTVPGMVLGTPYYMAPEQMRGDDVDARADVYAFGVILYEVLAGEPPFDAESFASLTAKVLTETPRPLNRLAGVPRDLAEIVAKAMAREPVDRFHSLAELVQALAPFRTGRYERQPAMSSTSSRHVVERFDVPRPPRRSNSGPVAAFLAALAFVVAGTWATRSTTPEQAAETATAPLQDLELEQQKPEPKAPSSTLLHETEAVADARVARVAAAAREPEHLAFARRRTRPLAAADRSVRANVSAETLKERPITTQRLGNGLIDPFSAR